MGTRGWFQRFGSSFSEFLLAEGDWMERSGRKFLQGTFCFQLSTVFQIIKVLDSIPHLLSLSLFGELLTQA